MTERPVGRYTVISADCHAGADILDYRAYLPSRYYEDFDAWSAEFKDPFRAMQEAPDRNWDSARRMRELEIDGIAAEVVFPNTCPPFRIGKPVQELTAREYELRWAGVQAHNRWLVDFCAEAPGRRAGAFDILLLNVDDAVEEVRRCRDAGLTGGVVLPGVPPGAGIPELYSDVYDPLWAVCADLDVPLNHHAGSASPPMGADPAARSVFFMEVAWFSHRALWHLMLGGAFSRHPGLKLVFIEQGASWIPETINILDYLVRKPFVGALPGGTGPRTVWERNCYVGASFMRPCEVSKRYDIGIDKIMWGADYPHLEGTFPHSREALRLSFADLPQHEVAAMVGGNVARLYGFDMQALALIGNRIGPSVDEISEPLTVMPAGATSPLFDPDAPES
jgi:predicted TIM-barrel fold metal-dependent hydrolase